MRGQAMRTLRNTDQTGKREFHKPEMSDPLEPSNLVQLDLDCREIFERRDLDREIERRRLKRLKKSKSTLQEEGAPTASQKGMRKSRIPTLPSHSDEYIARLSYAFIHRQVDLNQWQFCQFEHADRAAIHLLYVRQEFARVQASIEQIASRLPLTRHDEVETLWNASSYILHVPEQLRPSLNSVQRLRIRKRHPCTTIRLRGEKKYKMTASTRLMLEEHFQREPNPGKAEKSNLVELTGLEKSTIANWFKNRRARARSDDRHEPTAQLVQLQPVPAYPVHTNFYINHPLYYPAIVQPHQDNNMSPGAFSYSSTVTELSDGAFEDKDPMMSLGYTTDVEQFVMPHMGNGDINMYHSGFPDLDPMEIASMLDP